MVAIGALCFMVDFKFLCNKGCVTLKTRTGQALLALFAVLFLATGVQVILPGQTVYAGCKNEEGEKYKNIGDCITGASWEGQSIKYGADKFSKVSGNNQHQSIKDEAKNALGTDKVAYYKFGSGGATIVVPEDTKPGDKVTGTLILYEMKQTTSNSASITGSSNSFNLIGIKPINIYEKAEDIPDDEKKNDAGVDPTEGEDEDVPVCNIGDGLGWLICPAATFSAKLADGAFAFLSVMLEYETLANPASREALFAQWVLMRNFANVIFAISFVIVVYSTMTGIGVSNYNLKRMVPRLIVAAVLVNASFWLCQLAVDISNIIGSNITGIMEAAREVATKADPENRYGEGLWEEKVALLLGGAATATAGAAAISYGTLIPMVALMLPLLYSALAAILLVIVLLVARQALITLLVIISPIAFALYILPNTSKWFDRWRSTFVAMLIIYPAVALLFSGSKLAATVVRLSGESPEDAAIPFEDGWTDLVSLGIQTLPLYAVPTLMKSVGGVLNRVGAFTNDKTKGFLDRSQKKNMDRLNLAEKKKTASDYKKGKRSFQTRKADRLLKHRVAESNLEHAQAESHNRRLTEDPEYLNKMSHGNPEVAAVMRGRAAADLNRREDEIIGGLAFNLTSKDTKELQDSLMSGEGSDLEKAAKVRELTRRDQSKETADVLSHVANTESATVRREVAKADFGGMIGAGQRAQIERGSTDNGAPIDIGNMFADSVRKMSIDQIWNANGSVMEHVIEVAQRDKQAAEHLARQVSKGYATPEYASKTGKNAASLDHLKNNAYGKPIPK